MYFWSLHLESEVSGMGIATYCLLVAMVGEITLTLLLYVEMDEIELTSSNQFEVSLLS